MSTPERRWSDEQVHAFVDDELDAETAAQFTAQVQRDLALAERVARQRALRKQLAAAFDPVLREPVPGHLTRALQGAGGAATPIGAARGRARTTPSPLWWTAAAASVLAAALVGWKLPRPTGEMLLARDDGLVAGSRLAQALSERISAEGSKTQGVLVSLSFKAGDGRYCRTFSLDIGIDGLACRGAADWQVEATGRSPPSDDAGDVYRQASSQLSPSVLAAISRWQAGDALTPEEERRVRERDWR